MLLLISTTTFLSPPPPPSNGRSDCGFFLTLKRGRSAGEGLDGLGVEVGEVGVWIGSDEAEDAEGVGA